MILIMKATPQIVPTPTIQTLPLNLFPIKSLRFPRRTLRISCTTKDTEETPSDESLAAELSLRVHRLNSKIAEREVAFLKSRELLVAEISDFVGFTSEDFESKWRRMNDDEKWVLVRGFVAEWSAHFHPLSARSVKELVEEYFGAADLFSEPDSGNLLADFRKMFAFLQDTQG